MEKRQIIFNIETGLEIVTQGRFCDILIIVSSHVSIMWHFAIIASDNKTAILYPYYCFKPRFDNKDFVVESRNKKDITTGRAGIYTNQIGGYRAFDPKPLPPDPPVQLDNEIVQLLSKAERALGRLDGASGILPNIDLFCCYVCK